MSSYIYVGENAVVAGGERLFFKQKTSPENTQKNTVKPDKNLFLPANVYRLCLPGRCLQFIGNVKEHWRQWFCNKSSSNIRQYNFLQEKRQYVIKY
jgi:hypothetical protein